MKGQIKAISFKNRSVLLMNDQNQEAWFPLDSKVPVLGLQKGECEYTLDAKGEIIIFLKSLASRKLYNVNTETGKTEEIETSMERMNKNNNNTHARVCALTCATQICTARGEIKKEEVLAQAIEFLKFLENK